MSSPVEELTKRMGRAWAAAEEWDLLINPYYPYPKDYHITKHGEADKRYRNCSEATAYLEAEAEARTEYIRSKS